MFPEVTTPTIKLTPPKSLSTEFNEHRKILGAKEIQMRRVRLDRNAAVIDDRFLDSCTKDCDRGRNLAVSC